MDRIRLLKISLVVAAIIIAVASLVVSNFLTLDLKHEERVKMEVWAEAMRSLDMADETTDLNLVLKVLDTNNLIPVIVLNKEGEVDTYRNLQIKADNYEDSIRYVQNLGKELIGQKRFIRIALDDSDENNDYIDVCYQDSLMIKRLTYYPYVQLGVVLLFVVIAIFALLTSRKAEQNKVWVGLSKETAHQLGTPISSLMAWTEILKENYPDDELIPEMDKDVSRLQLIADRFSKIGSLPEPIEYSINDVIAHVVTYMDRRTSKKVIMECHMPEEPVIAKINASLFEWVIENLCKNAVDAMEGKGKIIVRLNHEGDKISIEVEDNGKGIARKNISSVFKPGFTTKKRGWGLGLSLAKRIVEEYHKGKIWVKSSEVGIGTVFRIEIKA